MLYKTNLQAANRTSDSSLNGELSFYKEINIGLYYVCIFFFLRKCYLFFLLVIVYKKFYDKKMKVNDLIMLLFCE